MTGPFTRRELLKKAIAVSAAATLTIVPRHVLGSEGHIAPSEKMNIAGVGLGDMGESPENSRHFSPNPTASGSMKGLDLRREGGNCPLQRLRPSVGRSKRASLTIDCPRLTPKS